MTKDGWFRMGERPETVLPGVGERRVSAVEIMDAFQNAVEELRESVISSLGIENDDFEAVVEDADIRVDRGEDGAAARRDLLLICRAMRAWADMKEAVDDFERVFSHRGVIEIERAGGCIVGGVEWDAEAEPARVERLELYGRSMDGVFGQEPTWVPDWFGWDSFERRWSFASGKTINPDGVEMRWNQEEAPF